METHKITCDHCGRNLSSTSNCIDWRLALRNEEIPSRDGMVTTVMRYPAFDRDHHFCGIGCLVRWIRKKVPDEPPKFITDDD